MIVASGLELAAVWSDLGNTDFCRGVADNILLTLEFDSLPLTFCGVISGLIFPSLNSLRIRMIRNFHESLGEASGNCSAVAITYGSKSRITGHSKEEADYSVFICCSEYYVSQRIQILKVCGARSRGGMLTK